MQSITNLIPDKKESLRGFMSILIIFYLIVEFMIIQIDKLHVIHTTLSLMTNWVDISKQIQFYLTNNDTCSSLLEILALVIAKNATC